MGTAIAAPTIEPNQSIFYYFIFCPMSSSNVAFFVSIFTSLRRYVIWRYFGWRADPW
jgi:hypothetical protein